MAKDLFGKKIYVASGSFMHERLGQVNVRCLSTATRFTARWKSAEVLNLTIPPRVTPAEFEKALESLEPRLLSKRPMPKFFVPGWSYSTPEMEFEVMRGKKSNIFEGFIDKANGSTILNYPPDLSPTGDARFNAWVNKVLENYSKREAAGILLPLARQMVERLGVSPKLVEISYGTRVLGRCSSTGRILLSRNLVFYPEELRELVIAHEFAHLTYLNHGPQFQALLNQYVGGRLKELNRDLNKHELPFIR